jgi:hypothetical protein
MVTLFSSTKHHAHLYELEVGELYVTAKLSMRSYEAEVYGVETYMTHQLPTEEACLVWSAIKNNKYWEVD